MTIKIDFNEKEAVTIPGMNTMVHCQLRRVAKEKSVRESLKMIWQKGKTLFIDARKKGTMVDRIHRDLSDDDIATLADTFTEFQNGTLEDQQGFCKVATLQDIIAQDYILTPGRYVGIEEQKDDGEAFEDKMTRLTTELGSLFAESHRLENEICKKLQAIGYPVKIS